MNTGGTLKEGGPARKAAIVLGSGKWGLGVWDTASGAVVLNVNTARAVVGGAALGAAVPKVSTARGVDGTVCTPIAGGVVQ